jgi:hypothetical protein
MLLTIPVLLRSSFSHHLSFLRGWPFGCRAGREEEEGSVAEPREGDEKRR